MAAGSRNPRIDTLRGISIILVLLHHFNIAYPMHDTLLARLFGWDFIHGVFRNGNYAVTMFFVISGFLITSNADRRWDALANVRPWTFYRLRAARIIPCVLLLLLIVNTLAALKIGIFENHSEFGGPVPFWLVDVASLTFWMNVLMSHAGWLNYVLCVQWSLSIEEVFYLSFPLLCLMLRRDSRLLAVWGVFIVLGPIWRATHQSSEYTELNAYLSCFDGIAFGCCAAVLSKRVLLPSPTEILVAIAMAWFYLSWWIGETAIYGVSLMAFGTALLLVVQPGTAPAKHPPSPGPVRFCGRLSYELYLFHLIVLGGLRTIWSPETTEGNGKLLLLVAYLGLSALLGFIIGKFYSEPLNRRLRRGPFALVRGGQDEQERRSFLKKSKKLLPIPASALPDRLSPNS
jgi:peptidoglycan/LPS O-acetylase OafA/YrhL